MNLTGPQQQALEHARHVLAEAPANAADTALLSQWYAMVRMALADLAIAFEDNGGRP